MRWTAANKAKVAALNLDCSKHWPKPSNHAEWWRWSRSMYKTHLNVQCPECRRWEHWVPRSMFYTEMSSEGTDLGK